MKTYLRDLIFPTADEAAIEELLAAYPDDPSLGSPFDTGLNSSITPEFKRISAIMGDIVFQAPRRLLLQHRADKQPAYSYCTSPCSLSGRCEANVLSSMERWEADSFARGRTLFSLYQRYMGIYTHPRLTRTI